MYNQQPEPLSTKTDSIISTLTKAEDNPAPDREEKLPLQLGLQTDSTWPPLARWEASYQSVLEVGE